MTSFWCKKIQKVVVVWNIIKLLYENCHFITKYIIFSNALIFKDYPFYIFVMLFQLVKIGNLEKTRKICLSIDVFAFYDYRMNLNYRNHAFFKRKTMLHMFFCSVFSSGATHDKNRFYRWYHAWSETRMK